MWQIHLLSVLARSLPHVADLYAGLGADLPLVTRVFLAWWKVLLLLPLPTLAATAYIWLRKDPSARRVMFLLCAVVALTFGLQAACLEAAYAPMRELVRKIG